MNKKILITLLAISAVLTSCGNTESNADPIDTESSSIAEVTTEATTTTAAAITSVSDVTTTQITTTENEKKSTTTTKVTKPKTTTSKKKTTTAKKTTTSQTTQAPPETQATQPVYTEPATQAQTQPVTQIVTQPQTQTTQKVTQATQATQATSKQTEKQTSKKTEKPKTDEQTEFEKAWEAVSQRRSNAAQREIIRQKIIEYVLENYGGTVDDSLYLFTDKDGNLTNENKPGNYIGGKGQWIGGMTPCPGDTWELFITDEVSYWCDYEYTRFTAAGNKFDKFNIIPWEDDLHNGAYCYTFVVSIY